MYARDDKTPSYPTVSPARGVVCPAVVFKKPKVSENSLPLPVILSPESLLDELQMDRKSDFLRGFERPRQRGMESHRPHGTGLYNRRGVNIIHSKHHKSEYGKKSRSF